jgi:cytochrome c oxidase subunit 2
MVQVRVLAVVTGLGLASLACGSAGGAGLGLAETSGESVFQASGCASCHVDGAGSVAPGLEGLYGSVVRLEDGRTVTADEAYLRESILSPGEAVVSGYAPVMPEFGGRLSDQEVEALIQYIRSFAD